MLTPNKNAPALTSQELRVDAPPERVFALLADIEQWPRWQPSVTEATIRGQDALSAGATFVWKSGTRITSTVELFDSPRAIGWRGRAIGTRAIHVWHLDPDGTGTLVRTEESMEGPLPRLMPRMVRKMLENGVRETLDALAEEA